MAKKKRVTRKQLLKEPDEFLTFSARAIRFIANNKRPVLGVLIAMVVVIFAFAGVAYFSNLSERRAYAMFEQGRKNYLTKILGGQATPAEGNTGEEFEEVIREYPSTNAARFSLILYGDMNYHSGNFQKAIELYQKALGAFSGESAMQKLIWNGLAHACEGQKDYEATANYFQKITETPDAFMKADAYYGLGRAMEALNEQEKALEAYEEVVKAYPDSPGFQIAQEKVLRLRGKTPTSE